MGIQIGDRVDDLTFLRPDRRCEDLTAELNCVSAGMEAILRVSNAKKASITGNASATDTIR